MQLNFQSGASRCVLPLGPQWSVRDDAQGLLGRKLGGRCWGRVDAELRCCLVVVGRVRSQKNQQAISRSEEKYLCAHMRMKVLLNSLLRCQKPLGEGKFVFYHRGRKKIKLHVENNNQEFMFFNGNFFTCHKIFIFLTLGMYSSRAYVDILFLVASIMDICLMCKINK